MIASILVLFILAEPIRQIPGAIFLLVLLGAAAGMYFVCMVLWSNLFTEDLDARLVNAQTLNYMELCVLDLPLSFFYNNHVRGFPFDKLVGVCLLRMHFAGIIRLSAEGATLCQETADTKSMLERAILRRLHCTDNKPSWLLDQFEFICLTFWGHFMTGPPLYDIILLTIRKGRSPLLQLFQLLQLRRRLWGRLCFSRSMMIF